MNLYRLENKMVSSDFDVALDKRFMDAALNEAIKAMQEDEVPVGAVIVQGDQIIASSYNKVEGLNDPTAHAEIIAIRGASEKLGKWRLTDSTIYVTIEPCCMCLSAIILARIKRIVFGAKEPKTGACGSRADLLQTVFNNYGLIVESGINADPAMDIMQAFFRKKRRGTEVWP